MNQSDDLKEKGVVLGDNRVEQCGQLLLTALHNELLEDETEYLVLGGLMCPQILGHKVGSERVDAPPKRSKQVMKFAHSDSPFDSKQSGKVYQIIQIGHCWGKFRIFGCKFWN